MTRNENINFHLTFFPNMEYISKILSISGDGIERNKEEISVLTGIPTGVSSGKVVPHLEYAKLMGLINFQVLNQKYAIELLDFGKYVLKNDPYISEKITKLICHYFITSKISGAELWYFIFRELGRKYNGAINLKDLEKDLANKFDAKKIVLNPFYKTYSESFGSLNMIAENENFLNINHLQYRKEYVYACGYTLLKELEELSGKNEITMDTIEEKLMWRFAFGWTLQEEHRMYERIEEAGIIKINKQLTPLTIMPTKSSVEVINELYSFLL